MSPFMKRSLLAVFGVAMVFAIVFMVTPVQSQTLIKNAFPNITIPSPVDLQSPFDETNRIFVVSQPGKIYVFPNNSSASNPKVFLDITDRVLSGGEQGLLGLAFHPNFIKNGYFYVNYTANNPRRTIISRFQVSNTNGDSAVKASEFILMTYNQPFSNHNGGQVSFGPDGYLYIAAGDGGSGGDPQGNGQNKAALLGKILRIDVNGTSGNKNYLIPPDNPFAGNTQGWAEEVYAYGMRNPWRFSFDLVNK
jgi:glucose/arabinose dehydrogenase